MIHSWRVRAYEGSFFPLFCKANHTIYASIHRLHKINKIIIFYSFAQIIIFGMHMWLHYMVMHRQSSNIDSFCKYWYAYIYTINITINIKLFCARFIVNTNRSSSSIRQSESSIGATSLAFNYYNTRIICRHSCQISTKRILKVNICSRVLA